MGDQRKAKGDETRQRLIEGVFGLVSEEGLQGLTAGRLAKYVGISKSTIFHHFASIDELIGAAMAAWIDGILAPMEGREYADLDEYLAALGEAVLTPSEGGEKYYRASMAFFQKALCDESMRKDFGDFLQGYLDSERVVMAALVGLDPESPVMKAHGALLGGTLDGLAMQVSMTQQWELARAAWAAFSKMFSASLQGASPT